MGAERAIVAGRSGEVVRAALAQRTGFETRLVVLGHIQRGGVPTATDRVLATRFGAAAVDAVHSGAFGVMTALSSDEVTLVDIRDATRSPRTVTKGWLDAAAAFLV